MSPVRERDPRVADAERQRRLGRFDEATVAALELADDERVDTLDRAWSCLVAVSALAEQGRTDEALPWLSEAVQLANNDERALGAAALSFVTLIRWCNDVVGTESAGRALLAWAHAVDDPDITVRTTIMLASALRENGKAYEAFAVCAAATVAMARVDDPMLQLDLDDTQARSLEKMGNLTLCRQRLEGIVERCRALHMEPLRVEVLSATARLTRLLGDPARALAQHDEALAEPVTALLGHTRLLHVRGAALNSELLGDTARAYELLKESLVIDTELRAAERDHRRSFLLTGSAQAIAQLQVDSPLVAELQAQAQPTSSRFQRDRLTGARDRAGILQRILVRQAVGATTVAVLDVRDFTAINTSYGFNTGNAVLVELFERLGRAAPSSIDVGRVGSDSFALVGNVGADRMEAIVEAVVGGPIVVHDREIRVSAAVGTVVADGMQPETALTSAELASHRSARGVAARAEVFTKELEVANHRRTMLAQGLRAARLDDQMALRFQRIVDVAGATAGYEALVRWTHPTFGPIVPDEFIAVAEQIGEIERIGRWVLDRGVGTAARCRTPVSINVSAVQLLDDTLDEAVDAALAKHGLDPSHLVLEVTETAILTAGQPALRVLDDLRRRGVRIALDDFGTGFSSLSHLLDVPASTIKLDISYVRHVTTSARHRRVVRSIVELASGMEIVTVAEGVESAEQFDVLRDLGCQFFQGYLFGQPLAADELPTDPSVS